MLAGEPEDGVLIVFFQKGLEKEDGFAAQKMGVIEDEAALAVARGQDLAAAAPAFQNGLDVLLVLE